MKNKVKDGSIFEGVFHAVKPDGYGVVLKLARKRDPNVTTLPSPIETLLIPASELVQVIAKDINFVEETPTEASEFKTDKVNDVFPSFSAFYLVLCSFPVCSDVDSLS